MFSSLEVVVPGAGVEVAHSGTGDFSRVEERLIHVDSGRGGHPIDKKAGGVGMGGSAENRQVPVACRQGAPRVAQTINRCNEEAVVEYSFDRAARVWSYRISSTREPVGNLPAVAACRRLLLKIKLLSGLGGAWTMTLPSFLAAASRSLSQSFS